MTTFDMTTGTRGVSALDGPPTGSPPDANPLSPLELLRQLGNEVVKRDDFVAENPTRHMRVTCRTTIDSRELTSWQRRALPPTKGRARMAPDLTRLDSFRLYALAIVDTCVELAIRADETAEYRPVLDTDGEPLTLKDPALLAALGCPDPVVAVRKIFAGSEPDVIRAGTELFRLAGYAEGDEEEDPQG